MEYKDYYKILGVGRNVDQDELKRAYRKLARKYHPDISKESDAEQRFKEIVEAYEVLKDPKKRTAYDQFGSHWQHGQEFKPPPDWNAGYEFGGDFSGASGFSDFFEELFGGRGFGGMGTRIFESRARRMKGEDRYAKIVVRLEDAYHGVSRSITLMASEVDYRGQVVTRPHTLKVRIPKGIMAGQQIRLAGQGGPGFGGGPNGDLFLEVDFEEHSLFRVEKRDIYLDLPVTPWEAALGCTVTVPTLGGPVEVKVPAGSQTGTKLRLKGRGLPGKRGGDQYVVLQVVVPKPETAEARALYEQMARMMPMNPRRELEGK